MCFDPPSHPPPIEIQADRLGKSFGAHVVLDDISCTIRSGDLVAIVGASGSGKTVFLDHLVGLIAPTSGRVLVADHNGPAEHGQPPLVDMARLDEDALDLIRLHWSVVFQRNALFSGTVRENVALWLSEHTTLTPKDIDQRVRDSLAAVALDVADVLDKDRDSLSGGMAKRVAIARAIAADPAVIFYDEPTTGLDPVIGARVHDLLWNLHTRPLGPGLPIKELSGGARPLPPRPPHRTTIVVTHDRELLRRISPRVVMLHKGQVCYDGPYESFGGPDCPPAQEYLRAMPVLHAREAPPPPHNTPHSRL